MTAIARFPANLSRPVAPRSRTLDDLLSDPMVRLMMSADRITERDLRELHRLAR